MPDRPRRGSDGQDCGASIPPSQLAQDGCEIGIRREHDELVIVNLVLQQLDDVQHHVDVGAGLALTRHCRAVDDLEAGSVEGRPESLVDLRIEVTAPDEQASCSALGRVRRCRQRIREPSNPVHWLEREAIGDCGIEPPQAGEDIVEIDEQCAFHARHDDAQRVGGNARLAAAA